MLNVKQVSCEYHFLNCFNKTRRGIKAPVVIKCKNWLTSCLIDLHLSEPLRRTIFRSTSIFDIWSRLWGMTGLLAGLRGGPPASPSLRRSQVAPPPTSGFDVSSWCVSLCLFLVGYVFISCTVLYDNTLTFLRRARHNTHIRRKNRT